jgi:hypothetical protein
MQYTSSNLHQNLARFAAPVLLLVANLVLLLALVHVVHERQDLRRMLASLDHELTASRAAAEFQKASLDSLMRDSRPSRHAAPAGPDLGNAAPSATQVAESPSLLDHDLLRNAAYRRAVSAVLESEIAVSYASLFRRIKLPQDRQERFAALLRDQALIEIRLRGTSDDVDAKSKQAELATRLAEMSRLSEQIQATLTKEEFDEYVLYQQGKLSARTVESVRLSLAFTPFPLSIQQADDLQDALGALRIRSGGRIPIDLLESRFEELRGSLAKEQLEAIKEVLGRQGTQYRSRVGNSIRP